MKPASVAATLVLFVVCWVARPASAQQNSSEAREGAGSSSVVTTSPQPSSSAQAWLERDLQDARTRVQRTRNALIGTSAGLAVGIILVGVGLSQCERFTNQGNEELRCNNAGDALLGTGGAISFLSIVGMITSGAMLGVAKRNKREFERELRRGYYGRRLQWDIPKGSLVF